MLNVVILMGRITKDPQDKKIGETTIVNFDIAVDNIRKEADGTRGTTFLPVVCFNNIGENVVNHLHKGSKVAVKGAIQQRSYVAKDGTKRNIYEVIADSVEFLDPKQDAPEVKDDDLPFNEEEVKPQEKAEEPKAEAPKFDPYTGKPLNPKAKK